MPFEAGVATLTTAGSIQAKPQPTLLCSSSPVGLLADNARTGSMSAASAPPEAKKKAPVDEADFVPEAVKDDEDSLAKEEALPQADVKVRGN